MQGAGALPPSATPRRVTAFLGTPMHGTGFLVSLILEVISDLKKQTKPQKNMAEPTDQTPVEAEGEEIVHSYATCDSCYLPECRL
jgi:hypothetical protein